jgi:hypothetical protein
VQFNDWPISFKSTLVKSYDPAIAEDAVSRQARRSTPRIRSRKAANPRWNSAEFKSEKKFAKAKWCPGPESNQRHCDFQSHALPTELPGHLLAGLGATRQHGGG